MLEVPYVLGYVIEKKKRQFFIIEDVNKSVCAMLYWALL